MNLIRPVVLFCLALSLSAAGLTGCGSGTRTDPYSSNEPLRDPQRARDLHAQASQAMAEDPTQAEALLRQALDADLYHGPSHNNLGILLLAKGDLYSAASEFEWARKLLPGHPDPRVNLAMTLEKAGKSHEALMAYESALEVYPNYLPALQGKAMIQVGQREIREDTAAALHEIALRGDAHWRSWAIRQQQRLRASPYLAPVGQE